MHELSVAKALFDLVADRAGGERVELVEIEIGALTGLSPDSIAFFFETMAIGTALEGARLSCTLVPAEVRCGPCGAVYAPEGFARVCTRCGALGGAVLRGEELNLVGLVRRAERAHV
jgi:hydrogenase nickel incorporation protein HypA/HybF